MAKDKSGSKDSRSTDTRLNAAAAALNALAQKDGHIDTTMAIVRTVKKGRTLR